MMPVSPRSAAADTPSLLDPQTYGEDLQGNLDRALALAPVHCPGCADYHIRVAAHRAAGAQLGIDADRPQLVVAIAETAGRLLSARTGKLDIVIAGSADTGILSTVAHAIATLGPDALSRCRFTVLDLCPTPLMLCEDFARAHGLDFSWATCDLTDPARDFRADIVVLHSVFRFIDRARQPAVLERLAAWIRPGGAMIFSNRIKTRSGEETAADLAKRRSANERFAALAAEGPLTDADRTAVLARLDRALDADESRSGEFRNVGELRQLLEGSSLALRGIDEVANEIGGNGQPTYSRRRVLAVLEKS
ncbi:methyltransferase domain-containing protein [Mesorhizobium sp. 10J20-29]